MISNTCEEIKDAILSNLLQVDEFNCKEDYCKKSLEELFSEHSYEGMQAELSDGAVTFYTLDPDTKTKRMREYKTDNIDIAKYIILRHFVCIYTSQVIYDKFYANENLDELEYGEINEIEYEEELSDKIAEQMPEFYQKYYAEEDLMYYKFKDISR